MSEQNTMEQYIEKYEALETRQRIMVLAILAVVLLLIMDLVWYQSEESEQKKVKRELANVRTEQTDLIKTNEQLQQQLAGAAFNQKRQKIKQLKKQQSDLDASLSKYAHLVSPQEMPEILKSIFEKSSKLKLMGLTKHPAHAAFVNASQSDNKTNNQAQEIKLYRHDFTVKLSGQYFDLLKSLFELEKMNIKVYWNSLKYKVDNYPKADIQLLIYTYSYDEKWIGA